VLRAVLGFDQDYVCQTNELHSTLLYSHTSVIQSNKYKDQTLTPF